MGDTLFSDKLSAAISMKVGNIASLRMQWEASLGKALRGGEALEDLLDCLELFSSPRLFDAFVNAHARSGEKLGETLSVVGRDSDEAGVSRDEFVAGVEEVIVYLESRGRSSSPSKIEGYVFCAAEFVGQKTPVEPLVPTIKEMLDRYGFDG